MNWRALTAAVVLVGGGLCLEQVWAQEAPPDPMRDAKGTFYEVKALIEGQYVEGVTEDDLWQGATEGMLARLANSKSHPTNHLITPAELSQLQEGIKGEITGVGIMIEQSAGALVISRILPGGGADAAGLKADDRILSIDGLPARGMNLAEVAGKIRGPVGTTVSLRVQRAEEEWTTDVSRAKVVVPYVKAQMVSDTVGLVAVASFTERAAADIQREIAGLIEQGATGLILDLRSCPGGLLDSAVDVAELFLPADAVIMGIEWAGDAKREIRRAKTDGPFADLPLSVLVNHKSSSGAEVVAAALAENHRALILGQNTFGKGTVEKIFTLENDWALKLSVAYFFSPEGNSWQGVGLTPDISLADQGAESAGAATQDPAVQAAQSVLRLGQLPRR